MSAAPRRRARCSPGNGGQLLGCVCVDSTQQLEVQMHEFGKLTTKGTVVCHCTENRCLSICVSLQIEGSGPVPNYLCAAGSDWCLLKQ